MRYPVTLTLPDTEPHQIGWVEADTDEELAARLWQRYPFLPPHHAFVGDRAVAGLLQPSSPPPAGGLTEGQRVWRERQRARRRAERWRQHWIDKDNAKRQA